MRYFISTKCRFVIKRNEASTNIAFPKYRSRFVLRFVDKMPTDSRLLDLKIWVSKFAYPEHPSEHALATNKESQMETTAENTRKKHQVGA